jgi:predicted DNA-binding protein (MmcQ/YjbR family)
MNLAAVKKTCASLPQATADVKWGADYVYSIGGKMFAVAFQSQMRGVFVAFKVDDHLFLQYTDRAGFVPAPYLARAKWVQVQDLRQVSAAELKALIRRSYQLVALKLTRKTRRELGLD